MAQRSEATGDEEEEDEDYMSDAFISNVVDIRPGLLQSKQAFRERAAIAEKAVKKPLHVLERERLEEGLKSSVGPENKGYGMLMKMGYSPGKGLGVAGCEGRREPVPFELRNNKEGFGVAEARKRKCEVLFQEMTKRKHYNEHLRDTFRATQSERFRALSMQHDLAVAQRVCSQLDCSAGHTIPPLEPWYWPREVKACLQKKHKKARPNSTIEDDSSSSTQNCFYGDADEDKVDNNMGSPSLEDDDDDDDDLSDEGVELRLHLIVEYLRRNYFYCLWCCSRFDDELDLEANCPGLKKDEHG